MYAQENDVNRGRMWWEHYELTYGIVLQVGSSTQAHAVAVEAADLAVDTFFERFTVRGTSHDSAKAEHDAALRAAFEMSKARKA